MEIKITSLDQTSSPITEELLFSIFSMAELNITNRHPTNVIKQSRIKNVQLGNLTINYRSQNRSYAKLRRLLNMSGSNKEIVSL